MVNFADNVALAAGNRMLGVEELGLNTAQAMAAMLGKNPAMLQRLKEQVAAGQREGQQESKGQGVSGFIAQQIGDPVNWASALLGGAPAGATKAAKVLALMKNGAIAGGASGVTQSTGDEKAGIGANLQNGAFGAGTGAAIGLAIPAVSGAAKAIGSAGAGLVNRIGTAINPNGAMADRVGQNILAAQLLKDTTTPAEVTAGLANPDAARYGATLGESTQSPTILQTEKQLSRGQGPAAKLMRETLFQRSRADIPGVLQDQMDRLNAHAAQAPALYKQAEQEAALNHAQAQAASFGTFGQPIGLPPGSPTQQMNATLQSMKNTANQRLSELGDIKGSQEKDVLNNALGYIKNAEKRGNSFESLADLKNQLREMYTDNPDPGASAQANRFTGPMVKQIDDTLTALAPNTYPAAKSAYMSGLVAKDMGDAMGASRVGSPAQIYTKLWSKPDLQQETLSRLTLPDGSPDVARQTAMTNSMQALENVTRGHGGSDTAFNAQAAEPLENQMRGFSPEALNPLESGPHFLGKAAQLYTPGVATAIARQSLNPNVDDILAAMARKSSSTMNNPVMQRGIPVAASIAGGSTGQPSSSVPDNPFDQFVPAQNAQQKNPFMQFVPQGGP